MKKYTLLTILILITTAGVFGLDFGGNLEDSTLYYHASDSDIYHADTVSFWLRTGVWKDTALFAQGSYTYSTDQAYAFDIDLFKVENKSLSFLNYILGRFHTSDFSGYVFNGRLDGASGTLNFPWGQISAQAGYTGLMFNTSAIEMTLADQQDADGVFDLESPRLVGGVEAVLPDIFLMQDITAGLWLQFDLRPKSEVTSAGEVIPQTTGGKLSTQYFGVKVNGSPVLNLYYDAFAFLGTGQTLSWINSTYVYKPLISFLGSAGARYYLPELLSSVADVRILYSSGDKDSASSFLEGNTDGNGTTFTPVTAKSSALVFNPKAGNLVFIKAGYSLKPFSSMPGDMLNRIQVNLTGVTFFRPTTGQISESGINPASSELYLGSEIDGTVNFRPYSDLGLSLSGGVFMPNNKSGGAFLESQRTTEFLIRLGLSFSF